jgi:FlaA1/EpsC-like NDP-sugar epimerase
MLEEEKLYEKLLSKVDDRSSTDYKRLYRKLYYIRNKAEIKEYQKIYYRNNKIKKRVEFAPPLTGKICEGFKISHKPIIIVFE